ncbi:dephospho-CoA kinase [Lacticaseibacillus hulanensis]|uniref:dephospho-CoA kinase n=1 Tax=Lacticaseibacillus hulanensis TaxID=2493111 RepID=UPI000FDB34FA|nr:dephospho-CoA kinase [Lacticaseibacillus hulanensis]
MTYKLGVTGGIATGKSSVASEFAAMGYPVVDADKIARSITKPGSDVMKAIQKTFGPMVVQADGGLNRGALASIVFGHDDQLAKLNSIMQPVIREQFAQELAAAVATGAEIVVGDVPLLYEQKYEDFFDGIAVSVADEEFQLDRVMSRDGLTRVQARRRIEAQLPLARKVKAADFAVNTMGPEELRHVQVMQLVRHIESLV